MPGIWGDRVAGLAHHLLAHIGDHYTPIQLLKTPNSEQKKYIFPASQLGKSNQPLPYLVIFGKTFIANLWYSEESEEFSNELF